jgi:hypothetical protein
MKLGTKGIGSIDETNISRVCPGRYHVMVTDVIEFPTYAPSAIVAEFTVLAGTIPDQQGRSFREFFQTAGKDKAGTEAVMKRLQRFAMCLGLMGADEAERDIDFKAGVGKQLVIEVIENEYQGRKQSRVSFMGMWPIGHKDVSDVPTDQASLAGSGTGEAAGAAGPSAPVAAAETARSGGDDWNNL